MLDRRHFLGGLAGSAAAAGAPAVQTTPRKNVLLLIADDLGFMTGEYGDRVAKTPRLDALAREGVRFTNAFCTTASCSASRSVILSGLQNHTNGHYGHAHSYHNFSYLPFVRPLPRLLGDAGYRTAVIGKMHVNPIERFGWSADMSGPDRNVADMAEKARRFLQSAGDNPWYLHVGYGDPHRGGGPNSDGFANQNYPRVERNPVNPAEVPVPSFLPDNPATRGDLAQYYEAINRLDQGIGFLLDVLRDSGQLDNTLIIFISDNGIPFPNAKTNTYDAGIRLPMIVRSPGQSRRHLVNNALVSYVDLAPTILDWAGAKGPEYPLHGRSILPVLEQENPAGRDEVFFSHTFHEITMYYPMRGIRTRQYKYIRNLYPELEYPHASDLWASPTWQSVLEAGEGGTVGKRRVRDYLHRALEELYDIAGDPDEVNNLARSAEHRETLERLRARVDAWRRETKDPWLINENYRGPGA